MHKGELEFPRYLLYLPYLIRKRVPRAFPFIKCINVQYFIQFQKATTQNPLPDAQLLHNPIIILCLHTYVAHLCSSPM